MNHIESRPTSTLDMFVRDALSNRIVNFVLDEMYPDIHAASSVFDMTVRELIAEYKERKS